MAGYGTSSTLSRPIIGPPEIYARGSERLDAILLHCAVAVIVGIVVLACVLTQTPLR